MHDHPADAYATERRELQVVATHVLARRLHAATGRFGLRPTPAGFGTPQFESSEPNTTRERIRVAGDRLVVERLDPSATTIATAIDGATLRDLTAVAGITLVGVDDTDRQGFAVGQDTPDLGDPDRRLTIGPETYEKVADWFALVAVALDELAGSITDPRSRPTVAQIWPEHFDLAFDLAVDPARVDTHRVNLGGSVGDGFEPEPYLYVGPWTDDRPGDASFWNAPFGAVLSRADLLDQSDPAVRAAEFFEEGLGHLSALGRS